jgi:hypothetical protein
MIRLFFVAILLLFTFNSNSQEQIKIFDSKRKMNFTQSNLINRIEQLDKNQIINKPQRVYYSGPGTQEVAIYLGINKDFTDISDFYISILSWVYMDTYLNDYSDIRGIKVGEDIAKLMLCKPINLELEEKKAQFGPFHTLNLTSIVDSFHKLNLVSINDNLLNCYKMTDEWNDHRYLFEYHNFYLLYNWYTGE